AWHEAGDSYLEATKRAPSDAQYCRNLALTRAQEVLLGDQRDGDSASVLILTRRCVEIDPNNPTAQITLAEIAHAFGANQEALDAAIAAIALFPPAADYDRFATESAIGM